ncbi:MobV family relaxase [Pelagibacterium halotolerans]|uniref:MobV family relaxase n=1 Tax=Pelagibacterium halotolerans TaxID=531813 RepID=UPI00384A60DE
MFAILRVQKIKSRADAVCMTMHGKRADRGTHYDRNRTHLNRHWTPDPVDAPPDWNAAIDATVARLGARRRKGATLAAHFLVSATPEFFADDGGGLDIKKAHAWAEDVLRAFQERYPDQIALARLDLDESSPHMDVVVVPVYAKKTKYTCVLTVSYRQVFAGDDKYEAQTRLAELQDWFADAMSNWGLKRGRPKAQTQREHLTHQEYAERQKQREIALQQELKHARAIRAQNEAQRSDLTAAAHRLQAEARKRQLLLDEAQKHFRTTLKMLAGVRAKAAELAEIEDDYLTNVAAYKTLSWVDETVENLQQVQPTDRG